MVLGLVLVFVQAGLDPPPSVRLMDVPKVPGYEGMSRAELRSEYQALGTRRPGIVLPIIGSILGAGGAATSAGLFWVVFSTPYGLPVYGAVAFIAAFVVSLAVLVASFALYIRNRPQRAALGAQMEQIEDAFRAGRCRSEPGDKPCENDPQHKPDRFVPQVSAPTSSPSLVIARF
jgi:hypothetical protein